MRWTRVRWSSSCRRSTRSRKRSRRATGPTSRRSAGAATAAARRSTATMWGGVPGGYRNTINDNIVLILMIETLEGLKNADAIAKVPGVTALFAASGDLGNFTGYPAGHARLRARHQHRPRLDPQGRRPAVRPPGLARPSRLHVLPGRQRNGGHRKRRGGRARSVGQHSGRAGGRAVRDASLGVETRRRIQNAEFRIQRRQSELQPWHLWPGTATAEGSREPSASMPFLTSEF